MTDFQNTACDRYAVWSVTARLAKRYTLRRLAYHPSRTVVKFVVGNTSMRCLTMPLQLRFLSNWPFINIFGLLHAISPRVALGNPASHFAVRVTGVQRRLRNSSELSKVFLEFIRVHVIQLCVPLSSRY